MIFTGKKAVRCSHCDPAGIVFYPRHAESGFSPARHPRAVVETVIGADGRLPAGRAGPRRR